MNLRLGKLPAKLDKRTILLENILRLRVLPPTPEAYDIDRMWGVYDNKMFANDSLGCCVISSRAHQTLRFEKFEQSKLIDIKDDEVIQEYFRESGGLDTGLYMLDSLKHWRNDGWEIGNDIYSIYAFASVDYCDIEAVKQCIHLLGGVNLGMILFQNDMEQFEAGKDWALTPTPGKLLGGHAIYLCAYDKDSVTCMTWGKRQRMSWDFLIGRSDEAYGIVDNRDDWLGNDSPVDINKLDGYLDEITGNEEPSNCQFSKVVCSGLNACYKATGRKTRFKAIVRR